MRISISAKFIFGFIMILVLTFSIMMFFIINQNIKYTRENIFRNAEGFSSLSKELLIKDYNLYYESGFYVYTHYVEGLMSYNDNLRRIQIVNTNGDILFDSKELEEGRFPGSVHRRINDPEKLSLIKSREESILNIEFGQEGSFEIISPYVDEWERHDFSVIYLFSFENLQEEVYGNLRTAIIIEVIFLLITIILFIYLSNKLVISPLNSIREGIEKIRGGDLDAQINISSNDEFGDVGGAFNKMTVDLKRAMGSERKKISELERFAKVVVGREKKMIELKEKIKKLEENDKNGRK